MRWIVKRPNRNQMTKDVEDVITYMSLDRFIWFDILVYSLIFCLLLSAVIPSLITFIFVYIFIFCISSFFFITCKYFFTPKEDA